MLPITACRRCAAKSAGTADVDGVIDVAVGLGNFGRAGHRDGEAAVGHGHFGNLDVGVGDDRAGAFVDDDAGVDVGDEGGVFNPRDEFHLALGALHFLRDKNLDGGGADRFRDLPDLVVNGVCHAHRGREIALAQHNFQDALRENVRRDFVFNNGAVGDHARGGVVLLHRGAARAARSRIEAAEENAALRDGINLAVAGHERGLQQDAALERLGVGQRSDDDVDLRSLAREGGDLGRDHDGGDVLVGEVGRLNLEAEAADEVGDRLLGELLVGVALTVEAGDDAVADQLIVAGAFDGGDILDAGLCPGEDHDGQQAEEDQQGGGDQPVQIADVKRVKGIHIVWSASLFSVLR